MEQNQSKTEPVQNNAETPVKRKTVRAKYCAENEQDRCVACGVCVKLCPKGAISIYKGCYATVDSDRCIGCGICEKNCPAGIMHKILRA